MDICTYIYIYTPNSNKTKKQWWEMEKIKKRKTVLSTGIFVSISLHIQSLNKINKAFLFVFSKKNRGTFCTRILNPIQLTQ